MREFNTSEFTGPACTRDTDSRVALSDSGADGLTVCLCDSKLELKLGYGDDSTGALRVDFCPTAPRGPRWRQRGGFGTACGGGAEEVRMGGYSHGCMFVFAPRSCSYLARTLEQP